MPTVPCACGKVYQVQEGLGGKTFRCKACNAKLTVPPDGTVDAAARRPVDRLRPAEVDKTLVGGQGTVAGNPSLLSFSRVQYWRCYPALVWIAVVTGLVLGVYLWVKFRSPLMAGIGGPFVAVVVLLSTDQNGKKKFRNGNLCAALVTATDPYTVAVLTDLSSNRSGPKLAIGIRRQPLAHMAGGPPRKGARLVATSFYFGQLSKGAWDDFMPTIINCGCADPTQLKRATASIDPQDWDLLERVVPRLDARKPGLHKLWTMPQFASER